MNAGAIVLAAGSGFRLGGGLPKQFRVLGGRPLLLWSCDVLRRQPGISELVVVVPELTAGDPPEWMLGTCDRVVAGGETRCASAARGLAALSDSADPILIHDGARPFVTAALVDRVLEACQLEPVIPVIAIADTVKRVDADGRVVETLDRSGLWRVQTPQGFPAATIRSLHGAAAQGADLPDDAFLCEQAGVSVRTVEGDERNLKVTTEADLELAEWMIAAGRVARPNDPGGRSDGV